MVSAICKAKNRESCPYHGAVIRLHKLEAQMTTYIKENGTMSSALLEKYIEERNGILEREKQGWTEADYEEQISSSGSSFIRQPEGEIPSTSTVLHNALVKAGMDEDKFGDLTGIHEDTLADVLRGEHPITPVIAHKIAKVFGTEQEWLKREREYSEYLTKEGKYDKVYLGHPGYIPGNASEEIQRGDVVDTMIVVDPDYPEDDGTTFYRSTNEVIPNEPYQIRIQANRRLNNDDVVKMASILGYSYRSTVAGENLGMPYQDSPYSFVVPADTTKSRRDDVGMALEDLEKRYPTMLIEGTPQRKTQNNTRAIDGFEDDSLKVDFYYDSAYFS